MGSRGIQTSVSDDHWEQVRADYRAVRASTCALQAPLSDEDSAAQSMPDASPAKWHLAHTSWFFETFVLEQVAEGYESFDPRFRVLFNSYYNSVGEQYPRPARGMLTRPSVEEVLRYRAHVDAAMGTLLHDGTPAARELASVIKLGLHHEQQHQELLLTDVKHLLSLNPLRPAYADLPESAASEIKPLRWHWHAGGTVEVGHTGDEFCFDNETPRHRSLVEPFELASRPVTNSEYVAFMSDGGYARPELWLSDGWARLREEGWSHPLYWQPQQDEWSVHTLGGPRPLRGDEPVCHLSYFEADAYASWAAARLPSEAEWECVAMEASTPGHFAESRLLHPAPTPASDPEQGPCQLFGDVWEWTRSAYAAYPGYQPTTGALGEYNGKFMCNQFVLRGGSCLTPASHARASYRNFFPPESRWQMSGLRLARNAN